MTDRACGIFTDFIGNVLKDSFKRDIANARYYCILNDGISDSSVTEQELVYVLFLSEGTAKVKFLSIERVENADARGIKEAIKQAFEHFGILDVETFTWFKY